MEVCFHLITMFPSAAIPGSIAVKSYLFNFFLAETQSLVSAAKYYIKNVTYSSRESHTGQLDYCNWLTDGSTTGTWFNFYIVELILICK